MARNNHYTPEMKMKVVQIIIDNANNICYVAKLLGMAQGTISNWFKKYREYLDGKTTIEQAVRQATLDGKFGGSSKRGRLLKGPLTDRINIALNLKGKEPNENDYANGGFDE